MSFRLPKTTSLTFLLSGLTATEKEILDRMKMEVEQYLLQERPGDMLRCLASSFNETVKLGFEESVPVLKNFLSFIRHRMIDGNSQEFKRLLLLTDHYLRHCGYRAQVLIGRKKFLETIFEVAKRFSKVGLTGAHESAMIAVSTLGEWSHEFSEYRENFPHYSEVYNKAKMGIRVINVTPGSDSEDEGKPRINIDFTAIEKRYPALQFA